MIAIGFFVVLLLLALVLAATGSANNLPINQLAFLAVVFLVFFLSGIYVAAALGGLGYLASVFLSPRPLDAFFGEVAWDTSSSFVFVAVPLFVMMGELLLRAGLSERLYRALNLWLRRLPGGLLHTNIATCAVFASVCGSSAATAAMIGSVALPYFQKTKYNQRMVLGSLAGGGALGQLIPPGVSLILYGLFTNTSIGKLYASAFVAGLLVTIAMMVFLFIYGVVTKSREPKIGVSLSERLMSLWDLLPTVALILVVLGSLYFGLATASEAAALGVGGALILAALNRRLNLQMLNDAVRSTVRLTSMLTLILIAAYILNYVLASLRLPQTLAQSVATLPIAPGLIMLVIFAFYIALGALMEGFSLILTTVPIVFPVIIALGYDPVWYGVEMTMLIEVALISPPDGLILYILQGLRRPQGQINDIFVGVLPFVAIYIGAALFMLAVPNSILWIQHVIK